MTEPDVTPKVYHLGHLRPSVVRTMVAVDDALLTAGYELTIHAARAIEQAARLDALAYADTLAVALRELIDSAETYRAWTRKSGEIELKIDIDLDSARPVLAEHERRRWATERAPEWGNTGVEGG